jgi:hypothetical protein
MLITACIQQPYAYGESLLICQVLGLNPLVHMGSPHMHTGGLCFWQSCLHIWGDSCHQIPILCRKLHMGIPGCILGSLYAYPYAYMGIFQSLTVCMWELFAWCRDSGHQIPMMCKYLHTGIPICIPGSPYACSCKSPKKSRWGSPYAYGCCRRAVIKI